MRFGLYEEREVFDRHLEQTLLEIDRLFGLTPAWLFLILQAATFTVDERF